MSTLDRAEMGVGSAGEAEGRARQPLFSASEWQVIRESLSLSPRQEQVLTCLLWDMSDVQIAQHLGVAVATVRMHLSRMFDRLGVDDRLGLVLLVFREFRQIEGRPSAVAS